jgi:hypothetical protein
MSVAKTKPATIDQLRDDIDRGRTGEKVEGSDPAAAPLGTDEEAAGTPISPAQIAVARQRELALRPNSPKVRYGLGATWAQIGFTALLLVGLVVGLLVRFEWL